MLVGEHVALQVHRDGVEELVSGCLDHPGGLAGDGGRQGGRREVDEPANPSRSSSEYLSGMAGPETRQ